MAQVIKHWILARSRIEDINIKGGAGRIENISARGYRATGATNHTQGKSILNEIYGSGREFTVHGGRCLAYGLNMTRPNENIGKWWMFP